MTINRRQVIVAVVAGLLLTIVQYSGLSPIWLTNLAFGIGVVFISAWRDLHDPE